MEGKKLSLEEWEAKKLQILKILKGCSANTTKRLLRDCIESIDYNSVLQ